LQSKNDETDYREILRDNNSLEIFLKNLAEFDRSFCDMMTGQKDFTLRFEVRGNQGKLIHCRVSRDYFDKPSESGKN